MRWNCGFGSFGFRVEFDHVDQNLGLVIWFEKWFRPFALL